MVDLGDEVEDGWFEGVFSWEVEEEFEVPALKYRIVLVAKSDAS